MRSFVLMLRYKEGTTLISSIHYLKNWLKTFTSQTYLFLSQLCGGKNVNNHVLQYLWESVN